MNALTFRTEFLHKTAAVVISVLVAAGALVGAQQSGSTTDVALGAALHAEEVDGDMDAAIAGFQRVIADRSAGRPAVATALLHLGRSYERVGSPLARTTYERLSREFSDQTSTVQQARARLQAMPSGAQNAGTPDDRVVKRGPNIAWGDGRVSLDGRFVSYTDWTGPENLLLHDLVTGADRDLTGMKDYTIGNATTSAFSPDGKQLAYGWRSYTRPEATNEIRVMTLGTTGLPEPRRVYGNADVEHFNPTDWSLDGQWLAVHVNRKDGSGQIALVGVQDGSFRALKTIGWRGPHKILFSPDSKYIAYDLPARDNEAQHDVFTMAIDGSRETTVVEHPADDVVMGWAPDGKSLLFASTRTGSVALFAQPMADGRSQGSPVLKRPNIGSVESQGLTASGALLLVKDASTTSLQVAPIDLDAGRLTGAAVLENFRSERPDWSRDGKQLAYSTTLANGQLGLVVRSIETGRMREMPLNLGYVQEPRWLDARTLVTVARDLNGRWNVQRIDAESGKSTFVADAALSRVQASPDGRKIYYMATRRQLVERDLGSGQTRVVRERGEGAREGDSELSPDGTVFASIFEDVKAKTSALMLLPVTGQEPRKVLQLSAPESFVAYGSMSWAPDGRSIVVVKISGDRRELWRIAVDGAARKLDINLPGWSRENGEIRLHPSGKQIAFFVGQDAREIWQLERIVPASGRTQ